MSKRYMTFTPATESPAPKKGRDMASARPSARTEPQLPELSRELMETLSYIETDVRFTRAEIYKSLLKSKK